MYGFCHAFDYSQLPHTCDFGFHSSRDLSVSTLQYISDQNLHNTLRFSNAFASTNITQSLSFETEIVPSANANKINRKQPPTGEN